MASGAEPLGPGRDASRSGPRGFPSDPGLALRPSAGSAPGPALTATPLRCPVDELTLACPPGSLSTDCPCRGGKPSPSSLRDRHSENHHFTYRRDGNSVCGTRPWLPSSVFTFCALSSFGCDQTSVFPSVTLGRRQKGRQARKTSRGVFLTFSGSTFRLGRSCPFPQTEPSSRAPPRSLVTRQRPLGRGSARGLASRRERRRLLRRFARLPRLRPLRSPRVSRLGVPGAPAPPAGSSRPRQLRRRRGCWRVACLTCVGGDGASWPSPAHVSTECHPLWGAFRCHVKP